MKINETKLLYLIKFTPILVTLIFYVLVATFLYLNCVVFFNRYSTNLLLISIGIIALSMMVSFSITKYIQKAFLGYKSKLLEEIEQNRKKDLIMFQQSKLATIGELLSNISHQWRQPLSVITTAATGIKLQKELGVTNEQLEINNLEGIINNAFYLSQTIDDFRNFYNPNVPKEEFLIGNTIKSSLKIVGSGLENNAIEIEQNIEDFTLIGIENELMQVIINIINNAKEQFERVEVEPKMIQIRTLKNDEYNSLCIFDNAGGIQEEHLNKVLEPYFSTKHQSRGTGIGLYMSQQIIEKHFNGEITVENKSITFNKKLFKGASFTIKFRSQCNT